MVETHRLKAPERLRDTRIIRGINIHRFYFRGKFDFSSYTLDNINGGESKQRNPENYIDKVYDNSLEPMRRLTERFTLADMIRQLQTPLVFRAINAGRIRDVIKFGKDRVAESKSDVYSVGLNGFYGDTDLSRVLEYGNFPKLLLMYRQEGVRKRGSHISGDAYDFITSPKAALIGVVILHDTEFLPKKRK